MASDDWNEAKYTESAWACIVALTKAADYYKNNTVDSPMLLDVLLNPTKHNAGDDADSAKRAVEKVLLKTGIDVSKLRQDLETHMSKQPKLTGSGDQQKVMGRNMIKLLEFARDTKQILGVSYFRFVSFCLLYEYGLVWYCMCMIFYIYILRRHVLNSHSVSISVSTRIIHSSNIR
jgi:ATP-dependent Clp protease ATP-binding subunit ClpA